MINENTFASSHKSFWLRVVPLLSQFVKNQNTQLERFRGPFNYATGDNRGLIAELSFRFFASGYLNSCKVAELHKSELQLNIERSVEFIQRFRAFSRQPVLEVSAEGVREASLLADRLLDFFYSEKTALKLWPKFPGCGWLDPVEGDGLGGSTLYEIKCGQSKLKGKDIRQVLCYLSLNHASRAYGIKQICIFNPRMGTVFRCTVDSLCLGISGTTSPVLLGDIVEYISEPNWLLEGV